MYTAFYGLREKPFSLSPDPRFLYLAASHREALAHLLYGIDEGEGFIAVTGEVGTGKTTLCRSLLDRLGSETEVAFLFNPSQTAGDLLHAIAGEFGFDDRNASRHELGDRLNKFLLDRKRDGRRVLLIVDEAQNLSHGTLEQIRLLSNLETSSEKLIQILLLGQPELDEKLDSPALRQLRQRISVRWGLSPMSAVETQEYVRHRLRIAAAGECDVFDDAALAEVHRRARGVPRLVNVLCDRALLAGFAEQKRKIGVDLVRRVAQEIPDTRSRHAVSDGGGRFFWRVAGWAAAATIVAALVLAALFAERLEARAGEVLAWMRGVPEVASAPPVPAEVAPRSAALDVASTAEPAASERATPAVATGPPPVAPWYAASVDRRAARSRALNTLLASFGIEGSSSPPSDDAALIELIGLRGLTVLEIDGARLTELRNLNHPALLGLRTDDGSVILAAMLGLDDSAGTFYGATERGSVRIALPEIEERWDRRAFVVWREFEVMPPVISRGSDDSAVRWVQDSLAGLGLYSGAPTGRYDERTSKGVKALQLTRQLDPDGAVGPRTKMVLYDMLDRYPVPRLSGGGGRG